MLLLDIALMSLLFSVSLTLCVQILRVSLCEEVSLVQCFVQLPPFHFNSIRSLNSIQSFDTGRCLSTAIRFIFSVQAALCPAQIHIIIADQQNAAPHPCRGGCARRRRCC